MAFRKEDFSRGQLEALGVKVDKVITEDFLFSEKRHRVSEIQQELYDYYDSMSEAEEGRVLGLLGFAGASLVGANLALNGARKVEKWMKSRDELERQREIELTGTYVNPFAGDVEEITDPITGETKKIEKKKKSNDDDIPEIPSAPDDDSGPSPPPPSAGGKDPKSKGPSDDFDDDDDSGIDILKDLI